MKSWTFWPWVMSANAAYCRPTKTPECTITVARKRACRFVRPNGTRTLARSVFAWSALNTSADDCIRETPGLWTDRSL